MISANVMENGVFIFKKEGHDSFIDYLKGLCILFVIMQHSMGGLFQNYTLFMFWGRFAVPIFLLIQVFHFYRKGMEKVNWSKLFSRIIKPFLIFQLFLSIILLLLSYKDMNGIIHSSIYYGGSGSGAYYPWIYIQFALLLPLFSKMMKHEGGGNAYVIYSISSNH